MTVLTGYFSSHLEELRKRLLVSFLAIVVLSAAAYFYSDHLVRFFIGPLFRIRPDLGKLVYTHLTEAFISYIKISLLAGLIGSFPVLCYELWMFVSPGLHSHEKRAARRVVFWATLLFAGGVVFAYWIALPLLLRFLLSFVHENLEALPRLGAYLTFVARVALTFGLAFEIPFLMVMAVKTGLVNRNYFPRQRKYYYPAIIVLAFLLTVGDPLAAVLLAIPLFGLYEAGVLISRPLRAKDAGQESVTGK